MSSAMLTFVQSTRLFAGLDQAMQTDIAAFCEIKDYQAGETAIAENSDREHQDLYLLIAGNVGVGTQFSQLQDSEEFDLDPIDNELYGEIAWILCTKRTAGVTCKERVRFLKVDGDALFNYLMTKPEIGFDLMTRIAKVLAKRVVNLTALARDTGTWQF